MLKSLLELKQVQELSRDELKQIMGGIDPKDCPNLTQPPGDDYVGCIVNGCPSWCKVS